MRKCPAPIRFALTTEGQPFRQSWLVAEGRGSLAAVMHTMLLPVPPIYAGSFGMPGLLLPDSFVAEDAPDGTISALVAAAEADLYAAGAEVILSTFVTGEEWRSEFKRSRYEPLSLYLSRTDLDLANDKVPGGIRPATEDDVQGIVSRSAENRQVLFDVDPFWEVHPQANTRFDAWMRRSLTLKDRDMLVTGPSADLEGYIIAQPASRLHFPPARDIAGTGVIDDYYHLDLATPMALASDGAGAAALLHAAEAVFARRGMGASFVVCPARWRSKRMVLEGAGYRTAMVWLIKR